MLFIILGAALRIYRLSSQSFWVDEVIQVNLSSKSVKDIIPSVFHGDSAPLSHFFLHYWMLLLGSHEFSVRLLFVVFGILSIYFLFILARELFDAKVALLSALLLSISPFHVWHSQDARMYSLWMLLSIISVLFFLKFLKNNKRIYMFAYVLATLLSLYAHIYTVFIILFQNL